MLKAAGLLILLPLACLNLRECSTTVCAAAPSTTATRDTGAKPDSKAHTGDGWAIAAPAAWRPFAPAVRPPMVLYLSGDGKGGVPMLDGTLAALQIGLTVESFAPAADPPETLAQRIDRDIAKLKAEKGFKLHGEPTTKKITLADGAEGVLFEAAFERIHRNRLSLYQRVYAADDKGRHVLATGFIACGIGGKGFIQRAAIYDFVQAHLRTLVLDPAKLDQAPLKAAYAALDPTLDDGLAQTSAGNDEIANKRYARAIERFAAALKVSDNISAAHNGLAWSVLQQPDAGGDKLATALVHAEKAVALTDRRDFSALDTLAVAYQRGGQQDKALATIKEALALAPEHPELLARLKELESTAK